MSPASPASAEDIRFWHEVIHATQLGAWTYDARTNMVRHSASWMALQGYADEPAQVRFDRWVERIHPDDILRTRKEMQRHLDGDAPLYECLYRIRHRDQGYSWILDRGQVVERAPDGRPLRIIGIKLDASRRQLFQAQLDQLAENVPGMLYQYQLETDGRSYFPYASRAALDVYGLSPEELGEDASPVFKRLHPDDLERVRTEILASARTLDIWQSEYRVILPGRGEHWVLGFAKPQRQEDGAILWHGYIRDVTEMKEQTLKLQATERLLQHLMNEMPMGLCLADETGLAYFRNRRFQELFQFPLDQPLTLAHWMESVYPDPGYREQVFSGWLAAVEEAKAGNGQIPARDYRVTLQDGREMIVAIGGVVFGEHVMATFEDLTEQHAQRLRLQQFAYVDGLTGIHNRRYFDETLQTEWKRCQRNGKPLSLLMVDIDHFKAYNDHYGHLRGDECLQAVAVALHGSGRRAQDLVARYGGEEFVCLLPECDVAGARHKAELMLQAVRALGIEHAGSPVLPILTVSIGMATCTPDLDTTPDALLALADANLYRAKMSGRNRVAQDTSVA